MNLQKPYGIFLPQEVVLEDNTEKSQPERESLPYPELPADALIIIPVRNMVLFPGMVIPITIGRQNSITAAQEAIRKDHQIGIVMQRDPDSPGISLKEMHSVGTISNILRYVTTSSNSHNIICQGEGRFRLIELLDGYPFLVARVERYPEDEEDNIEVQGRMIQLKQRAGEIMDMLPQLPPELSESIQNIGSASLLTDLISGLMDLKPEDKQEILEIPDLKVRMDKLLTLLNYRLEVLKVSHDIDKQTQERLGERHREVLLREQLRTIQKQLGEVEETTSEVAQLSEAIAKAKMPEEANTQAIKELNRLKNMPEASGEYSMLLTYLEWLTELPWSIFSEDRTDIAQARKMLDKDHYGLEKVKRRILEFLAVHKLNPKGKSPLLCFIGPPGVGKTSLGQSIAKATGRKFVRVSLGGVHDEAEIRGHRRTYIGALPGNIIQAIRKAGAHNCVMLLDEIDKLGMSVQGDPASALLEVLDPEQNNTFRDNYLALPFDLSKVMFICTANMPDTIPGPLRDRMEMIELPGYTEQEKAQIARRYLVKRQLDANGLKSSQCKITNAAIHTLINDYTREAGVRTLEREIGSLFRSVAIRIAEGTATQVTINPRDLHTVLGPPPFENEVAMRASVSGVATGLAWTPVGGDILFIEASRVPGKDKMTLTGQLGDVMKESAMAALTLLKAHATELKIDPKVFENSEIHVHIPAGAIPKDGPSAGVTMFLAMASLMMNKPIYSDHAMTGEISLRGLVLPVGGIKEKVLAALRAGIKTVMLPARNKKDLEDIPEEARNKMEFIFLNTVDDALREGLVKPKPRKKIK